MSDPTTNGGMPEEQEAPSVRIIAHYVRDLSFENVAAQEGSQVEGRPEIGVQVNLDASAVAENRFQVVMSINATATTAGSTRFIVELEYVGVFDIENVPQEHVHPFIFIECPRQILPYARRVISDVIGQGVVGCDVGARAGFGRAVRTDIAVCQKRAQAFDAAHHGREVRRITQKAEVDFKARGTEP